MGSMLLGCFFLFCRLPAFLFYFILSAGLVLLEGLCFVINILRVNSYYYIIYNLVQEYHSGWKLLPCKLNLLGSKGWPLKGDPSASHAFFKTSSCFSYYVVGKPICFLCCSYIILRIAPCVSSSN